MLGELRDEKDPGLALKEGVNNLTGGCLSIYNSPESRCAKAIVEVERRGKYKGGGVWGLEGELPLRGASENQWRFEGGQGGEDPFSLKKQREQVTARSPAWSDSKMATA